MSESPEKFGGKHRDSIHFVENRLEETETIMQSLWSTADRMEKEFEASAAEREKALTLIAPLKAIIENARAQPWYKQWLLTAQQKATIQQVAATLEKIKPHTEKIDAAVLKAKSDLENIATLLKVAESDWKKKLNS